MTEHREDIDWSKTTYEGVRREQLRRVQSMSLRQRLEALDELTRLAERMQAMPKQPGDAPADKVGSGVHEDGQRYPAAGTLHALVLEGCKPTPLASYLKALGILRLVAEQADPDACGYWMDEAFVLQSTLDRAALQAFFLDHYRPTPILAPWNGGSGFYFQERKLSAKDPLTGKRIKTGIRDQPTEATKVVDSVLGSSCERLGCFRSAIQQCKLQVRAFGFLEAPKEREKDRFVEALRSRLADDALVWLDAALLVTSEQTKFPPLLGTGGNDGNLDFTNNFLQRLVSLIDCETGEATPLARQQLPESLFGVAVPGQISAAIGQFAPGGAGSPNGTTGFESKSGFNPWDFVFMLEGAVLFAAAATRRLESRDPVALSYPFTVRTTGSSDGSTALEDEGSARAEVWMPLWSRATTLDELRALLSEGRVTLQRRPARDGLDFIRAVSQLGVQRGISAFQRYGFLMRSGKAFLATPLNRVRVQRNPAANLIDELDTYRWLQRFRSLGRRREAAARLRSLVRRLEDALFDLARFGDPRHVQQVLVALGQVQAYLATSPGARKDCPPVPRLSTAWSLAADDGSANFRIAAALAGLHRPAGDDGGRPDMPMAVHFAPVDPGGKGAWPKDPKLAAMVWRAGSLCRNLFAVAERRLLDAEREGHGGGKPLAHCASVAPAHIAEWLASPAMDAQVDALLRGLVLTRIPWRFPGRTPPAAPLPAAYAALKPLFCTEQQLRRCELLAADARLPLERAWLKRLWLGAPDALRQATRRLHAAGLRLETDHIDLGFTNPQRLLAGLLIPVADDDLKRLLKRLQSSTRDPEPAIA